MTAEAMGHADIVEEQILLESDVVVRLAAVADHGARAPFNVGYFPIHPGTFSVLGGIVAGDMSDGVLYDPDGKSVGSIDYDTGKGTLDWNLLNRAPAFWVRYRYKVQDA
jgi:hypothetical protein